MDLLGQRCADILDHLRSKVSAEEVGKEEARHVYTLVRIPISVIIGNPSRIDPENLPRDVCKEAGLCIGHVLYQTNVRKEFLIQNVLDYEGSLRLGGPGVDMLREPGERLLLCRDRGILRLHHRLIENTVVDGISIRTKNEITNLTIVFYTQGAEQNPEGNVCLDARHRGLEQPDLLILGMVHDFDCIVLGHLIVIRSDRLHLNDFYFLRRVAVVAEDKGAIL